MFRFRAQAALDLRKRQDDEAQRLLADAQAALAVAETRLASADGKLAEALASARAVQETTTTVAVLTWHQNWITGCQQDVSECTGEVAKRRDAADVALEQAQQARRRLRSLERYRERLLQTYERDAQRVEQKALDLFANLQHAARRHVPEGG